MIRTWISAEICRNSLKICVYTTSEVCLQSYAAPSNVVNVLPSTAKLPAAGDLLKIEFKMSLRPQVSALLRVMAQPQDHTREAKAEA